MPDNIKTLLESLVEFRESDDPALVKDYKKAFKESSLFVVTQSRGKLEFIPFDLISQFSDGKSKQVKKIFEKIYGKPESSVHLNHKLTGFYKKNGLKRSIKSIDNTPYYLVEEGINTVEIDQKTPINREGEPLFFGEKELIFYSQYGGQSYKASDPTLKKVGRAISNTTVKPVNHWLNLSVVKGFTAEPERYWQVAGTFKTFAWGKLLREEHQDKKVFFALVADYEKQALVYKLDCLRSGTAKLSEEMIHKFDYFLLGFDVVKTIPFAQLSKYNWKTLSKTTKQFVKNHQHLYDAVINYLWNGKLTLKATNKLLEASPEGETPLKGEGYSEKLDGQGKLLALDFEKTMLQLQSKHDLADKVTLIDIEDPGRPSHDIKSYHIDGSPKLITVRCTKDNHPGAFNLTIDEIEASKLLPDNSYLYLIYDYSKKRNAGKLVIKKGNLEKSLRLEPKEFLASTE